ncbi:MAG: YfiR/HmsC family protein [Polyangia bacterium]
MREPHLCSRRRWLLAAALVGPLLAARSLRAEEIEEVNPDLAAQLFLKILCYDRNLPVRSSGRLVLAILYRPGHPESERIRASVQAAFQSRASKFPVQGRTVSVIAIAFDAKLLLKQLQSAGATLLYVTPGLDDPTGAVGAAAQALQAPTLTGRRSLLDGGLALAVVAMDDKPGIVINLPVARSLGMDLDPNLLRVAEVKK